jgi:D-cysteine desulfhydrase family pyridoxal phosphate-dependent enzyme
MNEKIFEPFPRMRFSVLPTPFQKLENISRICRRTIYCKRDDLTGFAFGGNKTRKLDFLIGDAKKNGATTIIAVGAVQSNFCRMAAAAGKSAGLEVILLLGGKPTGKPTGNLLLDYIFGADITFTDSLEWDVWERESEILAKELGNKGKKVYTLPVGGSTTIGALGYTMAFLEIMEQSRSMNININAIVHATSSAGTQAGLVVGKALTGWTGKIIGMGVAKDKPKLTKEVYELACATAAPFNIRVKPEDVIVDDSYRGARYGARTEECAEAIALFAQQEGILLDNVYTGKAAAGLMDYAKRGLFLPDMNICFIHTGGTVELFE